MKCKKAFTLVELIIVITILAILSVSAFIVVSQWIISSRDSRRIADLEIIRKWFASYKIDKSTYPQPDGTLSQWFINGTLVAIKGELGSASSGLLGLKNAVTDPVSKQSYAYWITADAKQYQVGVALENASVSTLNSIYAWESLARVIGDFEWYNPIVTNTWIILASFPSLLFQTSSSTWDLTSSTTYFVTNNQKNLPYSINWQPTQSTWSNQPVTLLNIWSLSSEAELENQLTKLSISANDIKLVKDALQTKWVTLTSSANLVNWLNYSKAIKLTDFWWQDSVAASLQIGDSYYFLWYTYSDTSAYSSIWWWPNGWQNDFYVVKTDLNYNLVAVKQYTGTYYEYLYGALQIDQDNILFRWFTQSDWSRFSSIWWTVSSGTITPWVTYPWTVFYAIVDTKTLNLKKIAMYWTNTANGTYSAWGQGCVYAKYIYCLTTFSDTTTPFAAVWWVGAGVYIAKFTKELQLINFIPLSLSWQPSWTSTISSIIPEKDWIILAGNLSWTATVLWQQYSTVWAQWDGLIIKTDFDLNTIKSAVIWTSVWPENFPWIVSDWEGWYIISSFSSWDRSVYSGVWWQPRISPAWFRDCVLLKVGGDLSLKRVKQLSNGAARHCVFWNNINVLGDKLYAFQLSTWSWASLWSLAYQPAASVDGNDIVMFRLDKHTLALEKMNLIPWNTITTQLRAYPGNVLVKGSSILLNFLMRRQSADNLFPSSTSSAAYMVELK